MPTNISIPTEEVKLLYNQLEEDGRRKWTMQKIADHFGVTKSAIHWHLRHKRKTSPEKQPIEVTCDGCNKKFKFKRGPGRPTPFHYCGDPCVKPAAPGEVWRTLATEILE